MVIVAADDEMPALSNIKSALIKLRPDDDIYTFSDPDDLIEFAKTTRVDIACLDIQMYDTTGVEVANSLKKINPKVNIIFVTAHDDFTTDAMKMHASGYIMKPFSLDTLRKELDDLRYEPRLKMNIQMKVKCFGNFEVFTPGEELVKFSRAKSKEAFAYLIVLKGSSCTINELAGILFEDEEYDSKKKIYIQKIISDMLHDLETAGMIKVIRKSYNSIAIDPKLIECDYYLYLEGRFNRGKYFGEFMNQYSWAEFYAPQD